MRKGLKQVLLISMIAFVLLATSGVAFCQDGVITKSVTITGRGDFFPPSFRVTEPARLRIEIRAVGVEFADKPSIVVSPGTPNFWRLQPSSTATLHVWETLNYAQPNRAYNVRIAGWLKGTGGPGTEPPPDWYANVPQCDIDTTETDETTEESPGLVLAKSNTAWKTANIIAGPTGVGETVTLYLPEDKTKIVVEVMGQERTGSVVINPSQVASIRIKSANYDTGTERITLRYEVPGETYLKDVLVVNVVDEDLQIVPAIDYLCLDGETVLWTYIADGAGVERVTSRWSLNFTGDGQIEIVQIFRNNMWRDPPAGRVVVAEGIRIKATEASSIPDDVKIEAKYRNLAANEELTVVAVELDGWFETISGEVLHTTVMPNNTFPSVEAPFEHFFVTATPDIPDLSLRLERIAIDPDTPDKGTIYHPAFFYSSEPDHNYEGPWYASKQETWDNKCADDPILQNQTVTFAVKMGDCTLDTLDIFVLSGFNYLVFRGEYQKAIDYIYDKYSLAGNATYAPALGDRGKTDLFGNITIGPLAFGSENILASTLIHERVHLNQGAIRRDLMSIAQGFYLAGIRTILVWPWPIGEVEAYEAEVDKFGFTCLSAIERGSVHGSKQEYIDIGEECGYVW